MNEDNKQEDIENAIDKAEYNLTSKQEDFLLEQAREEIDEKE